MKKSLVLAMAMALGVTASAYAANPFSDVPAGHWAYDSVSKLAAAGIVQGYGDTTFGGDKLMTRYEMAEIVAKALAKGANVDKLAAEFADELNALGVRVAKLEKKADNVKITGAIKYQLKSFHRDAVNTKDSSKKALKTNNFSRLRSDITLKGAVNEDWTYTALIRNEQRLDDSNKNAGEETAVFQRAYVNGKIGGLKVQAGRYNWDAGKSGDIFSHRVDGVDVAYGKDIKVVAGMAQDSTGTDAQKLEADMIYYGGVQAQLGKAAKLTAMYYNFKDTALLNGTRQDAEIYQVGLDMNITKSLALGANYYRTNKESALDGEKNGWTAELAYKGAKAAKAGSWGLLAKYYDMQANAALAPGFTYDAAFQAYDKDLKGVSDGVKGFQVRAEYALAKGIVGKVAYYDLEGQKAKKDSHKETLMTEVVFSF